MNKTPKDVDAYIAGMSEGVRGTLVKLRSVIKKAAPKAIERISYGMPFYEYGGSGFKGRLIYFAVSKNHIAVHIPPTRAGESLAKLKEVSSHKIVFSFSFGQTISF